jgi:branched-chain amino acid aminotransferase
MPTCAADKYFSLCFHDGAIISSQEAKLHLGSLGLRYALSAFEGIRLYVQRAEKSVLPFRLSEHQSRLQNSLSFLHLTDATENTLADIIEQLITKNHIDEDSYIRLSVSASAIGDLHSDGQDSITTLLINKMGRKVWLRENKAMRVAISTWQRADDVVFPGRIKNISNYAGPHLALREAKALGFDSIILCNSRGNLSEGPTCALVLILDGTVVTPPISDGVLPSITCKTVREICSEMGIPFTQRSLTREDAYAASEAFFCGTGLEFAAIGSIDGREIGDGRIGNVTRKVIAEYFCRVRRISNVRATTIS